MFAINIKLTKRIRFCLLGVAVAVIVVLLMRLIVFGDDVKQATCIDENQVATYVKSFGLEVDLSSLKIDNITVPIEFNEVYNNYNKIQQQQGFNLQNFKGKQLVRYTFPVTNHPKQTDDVYAEVLTYKGEVVAADVYSTNIDGFINALK